MFTNDLFSQVSGKKIREVNASTKGYDLAVDMLDKHVKLPSAPNIHYEPDSLYECLLYLSMNNGYAESSLNDLRLRYNLDAPTGTAFLYRMKKLLNPTKSLPKPSYEDVKKQLQGEW